MRALFRSRTALLAALFSRFLPGGEVGVMLRFLSRFFLRSGNTAHNRPIQFVGSGHYLAGVVHLANSEGRQIAFLLEVLVADFDRKVASQVALAVRRFITMLRTIASKYANLVVVPCQPILRFVQQDQVLRL